MNNAVPFPNEYMSLDEAEKQEKKKPDHTFYRTNSEAIMATDFPDVMWVVPSYLPEGFSVLAGRQKLGKTWLAIDFSLAVATGGCAMGEVSCDQGDVLYVDLENGPRRIKSRIETLYPNPQNRPDLSRLEWVSEAPDLKNGFISACEKWRLSVAQPKLIIIDVLQRVKPAGSNARNAYENDYAAFQELQSWATQNGVAVLALHHTRKGGADDPLEALSGSNGLSACADTTLVLDRDSNGITLYVRGRDVEEIETALRFDGGIWSILGAASEVHQSGEKGKVLAVLRDADEPMKPSEIIAATGMKKNNVDQLLYRLCRSNEIMKTGRALYIHPERMDLIPDNSETSKFCKFDESQTETEG